MSRLFAWTLNFAYATLLAVASPWILWSAYKHGKYREGFREKFLGLVPRREGERPRAWLHAVSVGEVNLLATIIGELSARLPEWEIVISTTTKTGYDLACRKYPSRTVFYCPLDFSWAVGAAMRRLRPTLLVLAELELWPNLVAAANRRGVPVAIINGRLSDRSLRGYRRFRFFVARTLRRIDLIAAQNQETAERFKRLGARPEAVYATGSLKFDGAQTDRANPRTAELRELAGLIGAEVVWLVGSTQAPEEEHALSIFKRLAVDHPKLRLIIVPRHAERFEDVADLIAASNLPWQRRTNLPLESYGNRGGADRRAWRVLLVDAIGELGAWWGTAQRRLRWREFWQPRRAKHARTGGVRGRHVLRAQYLELPRHRNSTAGGRGRRGRARRRGARSICPAHGGRRRVGAAAGAARSAARFVAARGYETHGGFDSIARGG